ncbi:MAG: hypothetical protein H7320_13105 [Ferruginibacter sp.]|nr:hypothetical protein [Ferruginibacter sp.]
MKKILSVSGLFFMALLLTAAIAFTFGTDAVNTFAGVAGVFGTVHIAGALGFLPMPANVLGAYVGAPGAGTSDGSAGVQVINSERDRGSFMSVKTDPQYAGKNITPSLLRLEAVITNDSRIVFKTFFGDGASVAPTEVRLDRNDKFVITDIGLYLMKQTKTKPGSGRLVSYPNITEFGAAAAGFLENIFNGTLGITLNRTKWLPVFDTQRFLKVGQTQQSASTNRDQRSLRETMVKLTPHIEIDGSGTNEIEVQFPSYAGWDGATPAVAGDEHRAVLYCHGLLIIGGSANT